MGMIQVCRVSLRRMEGCENDVKQGEVGEGMLGENGN